MAFFVQTTVPEVYLSYFTLEIPRLKKILLKYFGHYPFLNLVVPEAQLCEEGHHLPHTAKEEGAILLKAPKLGGR